MRKILQSSQPLVSIIMPAYNAGSFLAESLESVMNQTYRNWELIAIDDASTDKTLEILKEYQRRDGRIKILQNKQNLGVSASANRTLKKTRGDLIARMDADDICFPNRIEIQVGYLLKNLNVVAVGGQCEVIDEKGKKIGEKTFPLKFEEVKRTIFIRIPLQQPSVMVNKLLLPKNFIWYDSNFLTAEEVEFLFRLFKYGEVHNLNKKILKYRIHARNTSLIHPKRTFYLTFRSRLRGTWKYGVWPGFGGLFVSLFQLVIVSLLPSRMIYPLYEAVRGIKKKSGRAFLKPRLAYLGTQ